MKKSFLQWHTSNGGDVSRIDGNVQDNVQPKREPNPNLKRLNYKFANQIEVVDAEILKC